MARRSAPPNSGPAYLSPHPSAARGGRAALHDADESAFTRFLREQIWSPEKLPGNLSILTGVGVFAAGIVAVRTWGDLLLPA
ncbi:hypothetical protein JAAARDRAFT_140321 [Jaapia argillacea MUCL 33604]|uniref:Uncharacterized protein n=1 Tax=Jaapia argillacea MUCL 33604 TaxID=933084 RepID=A0A067PLM6_9AGAM|nr:hypothetical protein JAAARDRAFT_140321 [Jaapia argillacea MUCL 33604]